MFTENGSGTPITINGVRYERQLLKIPSDMAYALEYSDFNALSKEEAGVLNKFLKDYAEEGWEYKTIRSDLSNDESFSDIDDVYGYLSVCDYCEFWRKCND